MKAVIGVDTLGYYTPALRLLSRMKVDGLICDLINVVEPNTADATLSAAQIEAADGLLKELQDKGNAELDRAAEELRGAAVIEEKRLLYGKPADSLLTYSDDVNADLVAVGSERKDAFNAFFFGSSTRLLLNTSKHSVLVGKGPILADGPISVVIGADHSDYGQRAIGKFLSFGAKGIAKVTVVTATPLTASVVADMVNGIPVLVPADQDWSHTHVHGLNSELCDRIKALGIEADEHVVEAHPTSALGDAMKETGSDLLVLGGQGHGFLERLFIGSVSYHMAVADPYPVLVMRV